MFFFISKSFAMLKLENFDLRRANETNKKKGIVKNSSDVLPIS